MWALNCTIMPPQKKFPSKLFSEFQQAFWSCFCSCLDAHASSDAGVHMRMRGHPLAAFLNKEHSVIVSEYQNFVSFVFISKCVSSILNSMSPVLSVLST